MTVNNISSESHLLNLDGLLPDLEALYKDVHAHPELSMQEQRTAGLAADHLRAAGYEVTTGVGQTGVVGLLRNGDGPTVMVKLAAFAPRISMRSIVSLTEPLFRTEKYRTALVVPTVCVPKSLLPSTL